MARQKHWYLGFLGLVGIYELPQLIAAFQPGGSWWGLTAALWFLWFLYFIPEARGGNGDETTSNEPSSTSD